MSDEKKTTWDRLKTPPPNKYLNVSLLMQIVSAAAAQCRASQGTWTMEPKIDLDNTE